MLRVLLILVLALLIYAHRSLGMSSLEDTAWEVRVGRAPFFPFARRDTLSFDRGRFVSSRALASGYGSGSYGPEAGPGAWESRLRGADGSVSTWRGTVRGDRIRGVVTVVRADGRVKTYRFRGRRRGA